MARVAVVIVNWNGEALLPGCLDALAAQTWRDFDLLVVDNGSTDQSLACITRHAPEARVIPNRSNLGFAQANNVGVAEALADPKVDYVLTLNNDTVPAPDFIERLVAGADRSASDYGSWQGKVVFADDPRIIDAVGIELARDCFATQLGYREVDAGQYVSAEVYGVNAAAALYSRRFIEDVAGGGEFFDRDFFSYLEDVDVAVRGVGAGWKAAYVADAVVRHIGSATIGVESPLKWRYTSRNRFFLQVKNYSIQDAARSLVPTLESETRLMVAFVRTGQYAVMRTYVASRLGAFVSLPRMLAKRRRILDRRIAPTLWAPPPPLVSAAAPGVPLSIVIPTWNGLGVIGECLAAVHEQTVDGLEVIVVDNGSTDGSAEFIRRRYPEVVVIVLPTNSGFASGVNVGIKASNGQFIALLNNDAVPDRRWAEELLAAMDHADIAASLMLEYANPARIDSRGESLSKWGVPYRDGHGESASGMSGEDYPEIFAASGGASIYRRAVFEHVGVFDPQYFAYLEDVDLSFRARLAGYRVVLATRATVRHRVGATAREMGHFQLYQFIKNSQLLVWKNMPLPMLIKVLPHFGVIQLHLLGAAVRRGALPAALRAHLMVLVTFPMILLKRRRVRRLQRVSSEEIERWLTDQWPMTNQPSLRLVGQALYALVPGARSRDARRRGRAA